MGLEMGQGGERLQEPMPMQHTSFHKKALKSRILSEERDLSPRSASRQENNSGENGVEKIQHEREEQLQRYINDETNYPHSSSLSFFDQAPEDEGLFGRGGYEICVERGELQTPICSNFNI